MEFFTQQDFDFFSSLRKMPYRKDNSEHHDFGRRLSEDSVFAKTRYWAGLLKDRGYRAATSMKWQMSGYFSTYTWARIMLPGVENDKVFFTIGVGSRMNSESKLVNTLDYKLDCQRTGVNALDPSMEYLFDKYVDENCKEARLVQINLQEAKDWERLMEMTTDFLASYEQDYLNIAELTRLSEKNRAKKIVRLCWNENKWTKPSGSLGKSVSKGAAFETDKGYGYEEWLFSPKHIIDGYVYGFIQAFNKGGHHGQIFDVSAYAIKNENYKNTYYWIGRISQVEVLTGADQLKAIEEFENRDWLKDMLKDLNEVGVENFDFVPIEKSQIINIRYKYNAENFVRYAEPIVIAKPGNEFDDNQHYVLLSKKGPNQLDGMPIGGFVFKPGHNPTKTGSVAGKRKHADFMMRLKHKQVQEWMHDQLYAEFEGQDKKVGTEGKTGFGTSVDLVVECPASGMTFYEIKTKGSALQCIREGLGQLLEYSLFSKNSYATKLVVVGLVKADASTMEYMSHLRVTIGMQVFYQYFDYDKHYLNQEIC